MLQSRSIATVFAAVLLAAAVPARAIDVWEGGAGDDTSSSVNTIGQGDFQVHDLDQSGGGNDVDWIGVPALNRHSYEARLSGTLVPFDFGGCTNCPQFERVSAAGTVLTEDESFINEGQVAESFERSIRWVGTQDTVAEYLRVTGHLTNVEDASSTYKVRFWDTTYSIPRWNAVGGQATVFVITNLHQGNVAATIYFYNAAGALTATHPFTMGQNHGYVLSTASVPGLTGFSGHAHVVHNAGWGGLTGKAVALEPATGFTFDTAMVPLSQ